MLLMSPRNRLVRGVLAALMFTTVAPAIAANSDLDPTFGGGIVTRQLTPSNGDGAGTSALQPDGSVLVGGWALTAGSNRHFGTIRHLADSTPDYGFGDGTGKVISPIAISDSINGMIVLPQGGVVVVGYTYPTSSATQFAVAKYTAAGVLDTSFNGSGKVVTTIGPSSTARAIALQPDGKYLVVGECVDPAGLTRSDFCAVRYNPNGTLDAGYGNAGISRVAMVTNDDYPFGVAIQPDGKSVLAGYYNTGTGYGVALTRLNSNGSIDTSFGTSGKVLFTRTGLNAFGKAVAIQPDGNILVMANATVTSTSTNYALMMRFTPSGALDPTFNSGAGYILNSWSGGGLNPNVAAMALLPTGQILVAGRGYITAQNLSYFLTARYTAAGVQDTTYNSGAGYKLGDISSTGLGTTSIVGLAVNPDGRITAGGFSAGKLVMARYKGDPLVTTPTPVSFTSLSNVPVSTTQTSNAVTIAGLTTGAKVPVTVSNGSYSINGGPSSTSIGYVKNGDTLTLSQVSASTSGISVTTTVSIGGVHAANNTSTILGTPMSATFNTTTQ